MYRPKSLLQESGGSVSNFLQESGGSLTYFLRLREPGTV